MATLAVLLLALAQPPDARLATIQRAFIAAADDLMDDRPIATCLAERLAKFVPVTIVTDRQTADVVLTVHDARASRRAIAHVTATLPDGSLIWEGRSRRRGMNLLGANMTCTLAEDLAKALRDAMRDARAK